MERLFRLKEQLVEYKILNPTETQRSPDLLLLAQMLLRPDSFPPDRRYHLRFKHGGRRHAMRLPPLTRRNYYIYQDSALRETLVMLDPPLTNNRQAQESTASPSSPPTDSLSKICWRYGPTGADAGDPASCSAPVSRDCTYALKKLGLVKTKSFENNSTTSTVNLVTNTPSTSTNVSIVQSPATEGSNIIVKQELSKNDSGASDTPSYEFLLRQSLVKKFTEHQGNFLNKIRNKTNIIITLRTYPINQKLKVCLLEGTKSGIDNALKMLRDKFPLNKFPDVTLEQVHLTPEISTVPLIADHLHVNVESSRSIGNEEPVMADLGKIEKKLEKKEPVENEPVEKELVEKESVKKEPVEKEPVENEPVEKEPVKEEPAEKEISFLTSAHLENKDNIVESSKNIADEEPATAELGKMEKEPVKKEISFSMYPDSNEEDSDDDILPFKLFDM